MDQSSLVNILKIHQPDVSNLLRGKLSKFSTAKLISFAVKLDLGVQVRLTEPKAKKGIVSKILSAEATTKNRKLLRA
jgi:hypothetical protein